MVIETQEQLDKAITALKGYQAAVKAHNKTHDAVMTAMGPLKNAIGASGNNGQAMEEELLRELGRISVFGLPETR
jgi:hypothetical protein